MPSWNKWLHAAYIPTVTLPRPIAGIVLQVGLWEGDEGAATVKWKRIKESGDWKALAKVVRFLQGRGFDAGTANRAARKTQPPTDGD